MRITVGDSLEAEVSPRATAGDLAVFGRARGAVSASALWCGDVRLDPGHPAGTWPLLNGARVTDTPGEPCAPPRGPALLAVSGPDAARLFTAADAAIGRADGGGRGIADPRMSGSHLAVGASPGLRARDAGSLNGSWLVADGRRRSLARERALDEGDAIVAGDTELVVVGPGTHDAGGGRAVEAEPPAPPRPGLARLAPLAASAGGGVMMAALTGRWWFALLGLVYPAIVMIPELRARRQPAVAAGPGSPLDPRADASSWARAVCVTGDGAAGFARAIVLGRGRRPPAGSWSEPWMAALPAPHPGDGAVRIAEDGRAASWDDATVAVSADGATWSSAGATVHLPLVAVSAEVADAAARRIAGASNDEPLPASVTWGDLKPGGAAERPGLAVPVAAASGGARFELDLDRDGPHLLVAGTTGSGKSAFLETLVLAIAHGYAPEDVVVALLDFKGGAGLGSCRSLPHVAGVLTDLEPHLARRALTALARELDDRKRRLADAGYASLAEWERAGGAPPRLVVVADEYQELAAGYPDFLPDIARLAAQGRSLGLHLVLATQRPAGAVTPEIRANVGTTIALRVASDAESRDLIGTTAAAELPLDRPGRAIVATGSRRVEVQCALPSLAASPLVRPADAPASADGPAAMASAARGGTPANQLWLPPLPERIAVDALDPADGQIPFGMWDEPERRAQGTAAWEPERGSLAIAGPPGSGRTTALGAIARGAAAAGLRPVWLPRDAREAARTLALCEHEDGTVVLVDGADRALAALSDHARGAAADALLARISSGRTVVATSPGAPGRLAAACTSRLLLGHLEPADAAVWGVPRALAAVPPGAGRGRFSAAGAWREVQVAFADGTQDCPLVAQLPASLTRAELEALATPVGRAAAGVAGDHASAWGPRPAEPIIVVGEPSRERDRVRASLALATGVEPGTIPVADTPFAIPGRERSDATLVIAAPTFAVVRELVRGDVAGALDERPRPLRVVVVEDGAVFAAQLAEPEARERED